MRASPNFRYRRSASILRFGNRIGYTELSMAQLKILQEIITLTVFVPLAVYSMHKALRLDYLWAALCMTGAAYFIFTRAGQCIGLRRRRQWRQDQERPSNSASFSACSRRGRKGRAQALLIANLFHRKTGVRRNDVDQSMSGIARQTHLVQPFPDTDACVCRFQRRGLLLELLLPAARRLGLLVSNSGTVIRDGFGTDRRVRTAHIAHPSVLCHGLLQETTTR
jgi:Putative member of DMT superfamily (DUF486)